MNRKREGLGGGQYNSRKKPEQGVGCMSPYVRLGLTSAAGKKETPAIPLTPG